MAIVRLAEMAPGMVLEKPIVIQGRILLAAGAALGAKHIALLKAWGVAEICVPDPTPTAGQPEEGCVLSEDEKNAVVERVTRRFEAFDERQEVMVEIRRLAVERELQRLLAARRDEKSGARDVP